MAVYVPEDRAVHVLNRTAQLLLEALAEPVSEDELVSVLDRLTDGDREVIAGDVRRTLDELRQLGIAVAAE